MSVLRRLDERLLPVAARWLLDVRATLRAVRDVARDDVRPLADRLAHLSAHVAGSGRGVLGRFSDPLAQHVLAGISLVLLGSALVLALR